MGAPYTQLYLHLVWSTWDRQPLITQDIQEPLYGAITAKCHDLKCELIAIGGITDHIHLLVRFHTTIPVAQLVKEIMGSSSHLVTHVIKPGMFFKWQGAYGAFTIQKSDVKTVQAYLLNQVHHHNALQLDDDLEILASDQ
jgi:putative transposase